MCRKLSLFVLLFCRLLCHSEEFLHSADSTYKSSDSCIVFVSTRSSNFEKGRYWFGTRIAKDDKLRFYNIYFKGDVSKVVPRRSLADAIDNTNISSDFMVYTEGHGKNFSDNVKRGINTSRIYGVSVIMFDWPSNVPGYGVERNFYMSVHNSQSVTKQFNELLLLLGAYKKDPSHTKMKHLSLFFHSMGNYVLVSTIKKYGSQHYSKDLVDNIIFNAPCVPARGHSKWIEDLCFQKNIFIMYNKKDPALKGATFLLGKPLLGARPKRLAKNAYYFNLKPVARVSHNCFLKRSTFELFPEIRDIYSSLFHARPIDFNTAFIEPVGTIRNNFYIL